MAAILVADRFFFFQTNGSQMSPDTAGSRSPFRTRNMFLLLRELSGGGARKSAETEQKSLSELITAANADLDQSRTELFFFLGAIAFILVTTASISHRELLIGTSVQLPILSLTINLTTFLYWAPIILFLVHVALLLKFRRLRAKCGEIGAELKRATGDVVLQAQNLRLRAASNFLVQWLIDENESRFLRYLSAAIYYLSLIAGPVFTLLVIQVKALPLHDSWLTFVQIGVLSADIALVTWLHMPAPRRTLVSALAGFGTWLVVSLVCCIPDSGFDRFGRSWLLPTAIPYDSQGAYRVASWPTAFLFENGRDSATGRPVLFARNLIVTDDKTLSQANRASRPAASATVPALGNAAAESGISLRGRDLRYAILDRSDLRGADFTLANLTGASLVGADLRRATFGCESSIDLFEQLRSIFGRPLPEADNVTLPCLTMANISLSSADLRQAKFLGDRYRLMASHQKPSLARALLNGANIDGLDLSNMDFTLATMSGASAIGTNLSGAQLVGANLRYGKFAGALFHTSELRFASLASGYFQGASFSEARLVGADLSSADLRGADFGGALLTAARFRARAWATKLPVKERASWIDLAESRIEKMTSFDNDALRADITRLPDDQRGPVHSRLQDLFSEEISSETLSMNETWADWQKGLSRDSKDDAYRQAFSQIITNEACDLPNVARAVAFWRPISYHDYGSYDVFSPYSEPAESPATPADPAMQKVTRKGFEGSWSSIGGYWPDGRDSHIPEWYDSSALIQRLRSGSCAASKAFGADELLVILHDLAFTGTRAPQRSAGAPDNR
ncbi:MAG: pentapeptide repeat-containing protein [Pseudomonadota bacterium]